MRVGAIYQRIKRGIAAALLACAVPLTLSACTPSTYAGISLRPGAADPELQALARRAQAGDKQAQLELGIRYEEGRGVPRDLEWAEELYRSAAASSGGQIYVYSPPIGSSGPGRVVSVKAGPRRSGLREAQERLERLQ